MAIGARPEQFEGRVSLDDRERDQLAPDGDGKLESKGDTVFPEERIDPSNSRKFASSSATSPRSPHLSPVG